VVVMSFGEVGGCAGLLEGANQRVDDFVEGAGALAPEDRNAPPSVTIAKQM